MNDVTMVAVSRCFRLCIDYRDDTHHPGSYDPSFVQILPFEHAQGSRDAVEDLHRVPRYQPHLQNQRSVQGEREVGHTYVSQFRCHYRRLLRRIRLVEVEDGTGLSPVQWVWVVWVVILVVVLVWVVVWVVVMERHIDRGD